MPRAFYPGESWIRANKHACGNQPGTLMEMEIEMVGLWRIGEKFCLKIFQLWNLKDSLGNSKNTFLKNNLPNSLTLCILWLRCKSWETPHYKWFCLLLLMLSSSMSMCLKMTAPKDEGLVGGLLFFGCCKAGGSEKIEGSAGVFPSSCI